MEFYSDQIIDPKFGTVKLGDLTWQSSSLLELKIKLGNFKNYPDPVVRWTFVEVVRKWIEKRKGAKETSFLMVLNMNAFLLSARKTKLLLTSLLLSAALISTSCGDGSDGRNISIPGVNGPNVTLVDDNVLISMVFENLNVQGGIRYNIPNYNHSYLELSPDFNSTGTLMAVSISLQDVFDGGLQQLPPQTLPGGRALPGVVGGRLPAVAFSIPQFHNLGVYLGPKVFGLFVPVSGLGIGQSIATFRFYSSGTRTGNLSLVGEDANGENAGVLLLLDLGDSVKKRLKKIANKHN